MEIKPIKKKVRFRKDHKNKIRRIHKEALSDTLKRLVANDKNFSKEVIKEENALTKKWISIVGKEISSVTTVSASATGILTVLAKSSVVVQEIKLRQNEILEKFKISEPIFVFKKLTLKIKP